MRSFFIVFAFFLSFFVFSKAEASVLSPVITESKNGYVQNGLFHAKPYIAGTTATGTEILIYFDGNFAGLATASGTNGFYYQHPESLPDGIHSVMVSARDKTSMVLSAPSFSQIIVSPVAVPVPVPTPAPVPTSTPVCNGVVVPAAPTLISLKSVTTDSRPMITGLVPSGTSALIYVDGIYRGRVADLNHKSGTANFAFRPASVLSHGNHSVWAITEGKNGQKSIKSLVLTFRIESPMPAPTLLKTVVNDKTVATKPFIVGVAKNDSLVKVYIDNKLSGEFKVGQHKSGTASFAYKPKTDLTTGNHTAYTVATDSRGKVSSKSNAMKFTVGQPVAAKAKTEVKKDATQKKESLKTEDQKKDESVAKNDKNKQEEQKTEVKPEENKKKISLNLIIFIAFLLGVIGWIIWVNKELVKEKMKND